MKQVLALISVLLVAGLAQAEIVVDYGWEDEGSILTFYGNLDDVNTFATPNCAYTGDFGLMVTEGAGGGTPQAKIAAIWNLQDGDVVTAGFWRFDDTDGASPSMRIWGNWNDDLPDDMDGYSGSAGGNSDYGPGTGWDYVEHTWTVADGHTGLMVQCRLYASEGVSQCIDDLHIVAPDHAWVEVPGDNVANELQTWGSIKSLFR